MDWCREFESVVCYGTQEASPAVPQLFSSHELVGGGLPTADYGHSESLGDSRTILELMIIARKNRDGEKVTSARFPG